MSVTAGGPLSLEGSADRATCTAINALEAVREALDIPHAATVGDEKIRAEIMDRRVMHAVTFLRGILDQEPRDLGWHVAYLRDRLAEHPATGYKTWDEAIAELRAAEHAAATCEMCGASGATEALDRSVWTALADGTRTVRWLCVDRPACTGRRFPELAVQPGAQDGPGEPGDAGHRSADRLAERAMDVIDQAVAEGKLPG